jgi:hypothetical protein
LPDEVEKESALAGAGLPDDIKVAPAVLGASNYTFAQARFK